MPLTVPQRRELERIGARAVTVRCLDASNRDRRDVVHGFPCGAIDRGEVEKWLFEKWRGLERRQKRLFMGAKAAIVAALVTIIALSIAPFVDVTAHRSRDCLNFPLLNLPDLPSRTVCAGR
ncbi:hypothetical protein SAMN02745126_05565 [Enhydrobacter aerosaccus]|uniref:Uncharacterized protein n=1 Tax=Enhydrobacter aerosaccus TaxID=225324 RepID=A0A1T4T3J8_9HYPH|nr:hypothetical protein [Enhydrobacter aerosaccus]SKA34869.1 hypothetical protein SAMN02745126_05565 [Enhydrobacter aerosaccus]